MTIVRMMGYICTEGLQARAATKETNIKKDHKIIKLKLRTVKAWTKVMI